MSREFVDQRFNSRHLHTACQQQKQLSYFTKSSVQQEITDTYLTAWADRKFVTCDYFLNWVKTVLRTDNFLEFFKHFRQPVASSRLINDHVKDPLSRVFYAEDSYFKYVIGGKPVACPDELHAAEFNETMFNALMFRHNDIIITDLSDINTPIRTIVPIDIVVAIDSKDSVIDRIAYTAMMGETKGFLYIDSEAYIFYPESDRIAPTITPHDLGRCPADYISGSAFDDSECDVVRKSLFSYVREEMEEYVFLKTLQRMVEPNGAIPITVKLQTNVTGENKAQSGENGHPIISQEIGNQMSPVRGEITPSKSQAQPGSVVQVPMRLKDDGSIDMNIVDKFLVFHYMPTESLDYLNTRIEEIEESIVVSLIGDHSESSTTEEAKNEDQVRKSVVSKQDKLRNVSRQLTRMRKRTDYNMLALKHGKDRVEVDLFYGSDFFLETESDIYTQLLTSPNPIESKSLLTKLARTKNRFNEDNYERDKILYTLLPYATSKEFDAAVLAQKVGDITFQYQTRFTYWIDMFEAYYGDILYFWEDLQSSNSEKLVLINNLITNLIAQNYERPTISEAGSDPAAV